MVIINEKADEASSPTSLQLVDLWLRHREIRWLYRTFTAFVLFAGSFFIWLAIDKFLYSAARLESAALPLGFGVLAVFVGLGLSTFARVLSRSAEQSESSKIPVEVKANLENLGEEDFEEYDRVRRIRAEKARLDFERNLRSSVVLKDLRAHNIVLFPETRWQLQPRVNVLLGRNGYGKSLILRALAGLLQRDEEATQSVLGKERDARLELSLDRDGEEVWVQRDTPRFVRSIGKVPVLAIPDSRFFDRSKEVVASVDNLDPATADMTLYGAHHFLHQKPYGQVIQSLLYEICFDYLEHDDRRFERPVFAFLEDCVERLTHSRFEFHSIDRAGRTGFQIQVRTEGNEQPVPIQYASQGTLSVLAMFGLIRSYLISLSGNQDAESVAEQPGIVLIDEADAHLHPIWQQKMITVLKDLFPEVQFIVSAHSPLFVAGCWGGEVAVLRESTAENRASGFQIEQLSRDFVGATSAELYRTIFEIEELDDTYLEYSTKASIRGQHSKRLNELGERRLEGDLSPAEKDEMERLIEDNRRIDHALKVNEERRLESEREIEILKLESRVRELETRLDERDLEG